MEAKEFVLRLQDLAPRKEDLVRCGFTDEVAEEYLASFLVDLRDNPLEIDTRGDCLLELIKLWDTSKLEIGPIAFYSVPHNFDNRMEVGTLEADKIAYRYGSNDVVLLDWHNPKYVMCKIAPSGGAFLDGLLVIAECFKKNALGEISLDDPSEGSICKDRCIQALGGREYEMFCTTVFGV